VAIGVLIGVGGLRTIAPAASVADAGTTMCTRGMPAKKCQALLTPPPVSAVPKSMPVLPPSLGPNYSTIECGTDFFSATQYAQLTQQFGQLICFRVSGFDQWIVFGNGMSPTAATLAGTPGGAMIATETCIPSDGACLDANTPHDFASFNVSYPPNPQAVPLIYQALFGDHLLAFVDSPCGAVVFDTRTLRWYSGGEVDITKLLKGVAPATVPAPPSIAGSAALAANAPTMIAGSCR